MVCCPEYKNHHGNQSLFPMSPIANMLIQIKNGQSSGKPEVIVPFSLIKKSICDVLVREGYISSVEVKTRKAKKAELPVLCVGLKKEIRGMNFISKPSRRMYAKAAGLRQVMGGFGTAVISTSKGVMSHAEAKKQNLGGEVIFEIW